jgi:DNA-binding NarL/FixJ family response regulator
LLKSPFWLNLNRNSNLQWGYFRGDLPNDFNGLNQLTPREFEVFIQSSSGKDDEKIAKDLCVEIAHIKNLKSRIYKKIKNDNLDNLITKLIKNAHINDPLDNAK